MNNIKNDDSSKIIGKVRFGNNAYIAQGTIIRSHNDSVTIGNSSWVLENSVLHLLPDNELIIHDNVTIGPNATIRGTIIGSNSIVEAGAIVCDYSVIGENCLIKAGSLIKQRDEFEENNMIEGFPGKSIGKNEGAF